MVSLAEIYGETNVGRVRTNNEDNFVCQLIGGEGRFALCAAIDGIGGYEGGEIAAEIARDAIISYCENFVATERQLGVIKMAVLEANNSIVARKAVEPKLSQMGCVVTAAIIDLDELTINVAHVGDSRLYQYSSGRLVKLSHDHSLVGYREEIGDLTEEEAMHHPQRNLIERSVGDVVHSVDDENFIDAAIFPIDTTSQFLFCSDGLSDMLTSKQIASVLATDATAEQEAGRLIAMACDAGGKDNVTVVIAKVSVPTDEKRSIDPHTDATVNDSVKVETINDRFEPVKIKDEDVTPEPLPQFSPEHAEKKQAEKKKRKHLFSLKWLMIAVFTLAVVIIAFAAYRYVTGGAGEVPASATNAPDTIFETTVNNPMDSTVMADSTAVAPKLTPIQQKESELAALEIKINEADTALQKMRVEKSRLVQQLDSMKKAQMK